MCNHPLRLLAALTIVLLPAACSTARSAVYGMSSTRVSAISSAVQLTMATPTQTIPPADIAKIQEGVYRVRVTVDDLLAGGGDPSAAGTWTLTLKGGNYHLSCVPEPDTNCANSAREQFDDIEMGSTRGTGSTVWFLVDNAEKSRRTGCIRHSTALEGCGPDGAYRLTWQTSGNRLTLSNFYGIGDEAGGATGYENFTLKPWTKIA